MRKFEKISFPKFEEVFAAHDDILQMYDALVTPKRETTNAAGYDFFAPFAFELKQGEIIKIPTGIKVAMHEDEVLMLVVVSNMGFKYNIRLCNQVGIIDSDYYNNEGNEGHIYIALQNEGTQPWTVPQGGKIGQGIFTKYLLTDDDEKNVRNTRKEKRF